jgi:hypothetical protein
MKIVHGGTLDGSAISGSRMSECSRWGSPDPATGDQLVGGVEARVEAAVEADLQR